MSDLKTQTLNTMRQARAEWESLLAKLDETQMTQPGVSGEWSVKDIIAHITWFEREMIGVLQARALVGSELWNLPTDERNAAIFEQNRHRSLVDVRAEAQAVFEQLMELMETVTEEELLDASHFADMPPDWRPLQLIADNSYEHYPHHRPEIEAWLAR